MYAAAKARLTAALRALGQLGGSGPILIDLSSNDEGRVCHAHLLPSRMHNDRSHQRRIRRDFALLAVTARALVWRRNGDQEIKVGSQRSGASVGDADC